jgi:hypothetical protein
MLDQTEIATAIERATQREAARLQEARDDQILAAHRAAEAVRARQEEQAAAYQARVEEIERLSPISAQTIADLHEACAHRATADKRLGAVGMAAFFHIGLRFDHALYPLLQRQQNGISDILDRHRFIAQFAGKAAAWAAYFRKLAMLHETDLQAFQTASRQMYATTMMTPGQGNEMRYVCGTPAIHLGCLPIVAA